MQAVRDLPRFSGDEGDLRAWIFTIAHHRLLDDARRRARRPVEPLAQEAIVARGGVGDVEGEAMARLSAGEVTRLLASLSEDQRSVLLLRVIGDLSVPEVARVIGKRQGAVKQLQRRALLQLRKAVDDGA